MEEEHKKEKAPTSEAEEEAVNLSFKKSSLWKLGTFVFGILFLVSLFTGGFGGGTPTPSGEVIAPTAPTQLQPTGGNVQVQIDSDDPILGDEGATLSVIEFSDFQCPFCARAADDALAQLKSSQYFANGQVNLVYKHFPLTSIHPQAQKAAEASVCAGKQGKFWEYHDLLFANQAALDSTSLKQYATQLGLNAGQFNTCLDSGEASSKVTNGVQQATAAGGRGTPYFVILNNDNGETQTISGAVPWTNFEAAIQSLL